MDKKWLALGAVGIVAIGVAAWRLSQPDADDGAHLVVKTTQLSATAANGGKLFAAKCAACHGANAAGSNKGPPLVHKIYEPNHHGDGSFLAAARNGARAHHWPYGDMPPVPGISDKEVAQIVVYVRELQRANGIY